MAEITAEDLSAAYTEPSPAITADDIRNRLRKDQMTHWTSVGGPPVGEPGLDDFMLRQDMSWSRDIEDKMTKFKERYPEGDLKIWKESSDPSVMDNYLVYRRSKDEDWRKLDADFFTKMELGDIADLSGEVPAAVGGFVATIGTEGAALPILLLRSVAGSGGGELLRGGLERARGYEAKDLTESVVTEMFGAAAGVSLADIMGRGINAVRGAGGITPTPRASKAIRGAQREGLPGLHPGQVSDNPLIKAFVRQSRALSPKIKRYEIIQEESALNLVRELRNRGEAVKPPVFLKSSMLARENEIKKAAGKIASQAKGGKALSEGLKEYRDISGKYVGELYENARNIETPEFDLSPVKSLAKDIKARGKMLANGEEIDIKSLGELDDVISTINRLDPGVTDIDGASAMDQMIQLRGRLFDLKTPSDGVIRQPHRLARELYDALTETINNPANTADEFVQAWGEATAAAARRFDALEHPFLAKALKTRDDAHVEALYRDLFKPDNSTQLKFAKDHLTDTRWKEFKQATKGDLIRDPYTMSDKLNSFDQETLDVVFSDRELSSLRDVAQQFDRLKSSGLQEALDRQATTIGVVRDLINTDSTAAIKELSRTVPKGSPQWNTIRAGVLEYVYENSVEETTEGLKLVPRKLMEMRKLLRDNGAYRFLKSDDFHKLGVTIPRYLMFVRSLGTDTGESIRRASIIQNITTAPFSALRAITEELGVGRFMTSGLGQAMLYGKGKRSPIDFTMLKRLSGALGTVLTDIEQSAETEP